MDRVPATEMRFQKRSAGRRGRPPRKRAGEVDERILDAARSVFLERGLAGASIDEIAGRARAGKPTIYARFPGKEALFAAVIMRNVTATIGRFEGNVPAGPTIEDRLIDLGATILHWALTGDTVDLMRVGISEASRLPDLAINIHRMARQRAEETVARLLSEAAQSDTLGSLPAFAPERLPTTTRFFMDLVVLPIVFRGLFGEKLESLRTEIATHVAGRVAFFLAACRHGGVPISHDHHHPIRETGGSFAGQPQG
jgi:AcrR family transcriptional regulator